MACDTRYFCDRCSERIEPGDRISFKGTSGPVRFGVTLDLCSTCHSELLAWLGPGPTRDPIPPRPHRGKRPAATPAPSVATAGG